MIRDLCGASRSATGLNRLRAALCLTATVCLGAALAAAPASALPPGAQRSFEGQVNGSNLPAGQGWHSPGSIAFATNGNVWISDRGATDPNQLGVDGLYEFDPFPSQTLLKVPETIEAFGRQPVVQIAIDEQNGEIFAADSNCRKIDIFDSEGRFIDEWAAINSHAPCGEINIHVAIDNSQTLSRGRVYLSLPRPEHAVEAVDAEQRAVDFPATASYIEGNKLTGTPSGNFIDPQAITVDRQGNIYVTEVANEVVDVFDSSGTFLRTLPAPGAMDGCCEAPDGRGNAAVDPTNGNVLIMGARKVAEYDSSGNLLQTLESDGVSSFQVHGNLNVASDGRVYIPRYDGVDIFGPTGPTSIVTYRDVTGQTTTSGVLNATVDPNGAGNITTCVFEYGTSTAYGNTQPCLPDPSSSPPGSNFSSPADVSAAISGLTTETTYHYRTVVTTAERTKYGSDQTFTPHHVVGLETDPASAETESAATLNGSLIGDGTATHYFFEWGPTASYGNKAPAEPGTDVGSPSGPGTTLLSTQISGLSPYSTYHYRVVATDGNGTSDGKDVMFTTTPGVPLGGKTAATEVHADRANLHGQVDPNGADTEAHFEYIDDATFQQSGWSNALVTSPEIGVGMGKRFQNVSQSIEGLESGTLYHFRVVGTNFVGSGGSEGIFRTFPFRPSFVDRCPNAHVRQQTGASLLLDCRAYELVSAGSTGGYDVESTLVPGQTPFGGYPEAENPSQVLYGVHNGGIPGTGNPTNNGVDPYVATRTSSGWETKYVGIPADNPFATASFSSSLAEADPRLDAFAFGGPKICSPCFADGSRGIPIHNAAGELVQGMEGSISQPGAEPSGFVGRRFSADGTHFMFGSKSRFEPDGNEGETTIYDRDLQTNTTRTVSKTPSGETMTEAGKEIGELDVSADGSRIVFGHLVTEVEKAKYWHLYMNVGDSGQSIDLMPGDTEGALYDGMTGDGSKVFFTTRDQLLASDEDHSADIYEAEVGQSGPVTLRLVSVGNDGGNAGEPGNTDACEPAGNTIHALWNTTGSEEDCGVVAVGGGGGVARGSGTIFFLSPELLDGPSNGVENAPNLYVVPPGGRPRFVRTLESSANAPLPHPAHPFLREFGTFENVTGTAIDDASGAIFGLDMGHGFGGTGFIYKFNSEGHADPTFAGGTGKLQVPGAAGYFNLATGVAVDSSCSLHQPPLTGSACEALDPSNGDLYYPDLVDGRLKRYDTSGNHLTDINTGEIFPDAVAVQQSTGNVYVLSLFGVVKIYDPNGNLLNEFSTSGVETPTGIAVDSSGTVYVVNGGGFGGAPGITEAFTSSGADLGKFHGNVSRGVAVDPTDDHVYIDEGNQVTEYLPSGEEVGSPTGSDRLEESVSLSVDAGKIAASNRGSAADIATFGPAVTPFNPSTDSPLVIDSVSEPAAHNTADFQVTPSGEFAALTSTLPLTGYDNALHREVFRYALPSATLSCVSCNPTGEQASQEATLARNGLSLTDEGRVFFNSTEGLVDRDLNGMMDVYEWEANGSGTCEADEVEGGCVQLVSTGASPSDSSLLGASANGADAYFFTRDTLVSSDANGSRAKIYDARVEGGFPEVPPPHPCQASDECHEPASPPPPPPAIQTIAGTPTGNVPAKQHTSRHHRKRKKKHKGHPRQGGRPGHHKRGASK